MIVETRKVLSALCVFIPTLFGAGLASTSGPSIDLDDAYGDHMVLQRHAPVDFRGSAAPSSIVSLEFAGQTRQVESGPDGHWTASFAPMTAGGPFRLMADRQVLATDVLVGDVLLCSGQSNMEFPVRRALNPDRELGADHSADIRLLTVPKSTFATPRTQFDTPAEWQIASAETVSDFSAVCYFTARELQLELNVPLGLVDSSWGGTKIESWMSAESLRATGQRLDDLALLDIYARDSDTALSQFGAQWDAWWWAQNADEDAAVWTDPDAFEWMSVPDFSDWKTWEGAGLEDYNGQVWYHSAVQLSGTDISADFIELGGIDELDHVWINGVRVGSQFNWAGQRRYPIPGGLLRAGSNDVVINVLSSWDKGGLFGPADAMKIVGGQGGDVALSGWTYRKANHAGLNAPMAPWESVTGITGIHNGMIAPLRGLRFVGGLWYQGESNAGNAAPYDVLLNGLVDDWKRQFGPDMGMLIVQLPEFGSPLSEPGPSHWAGIREAQRSVAASRSEAALVVTLGAGDPYDIHPPNKQEVARRTADAARALFYGQDMPDMFRAPLRAVGSDTGVTVMLSSPERGLESLSSDRVIGFELCDDAACRYADAYIEGGTVHLDVPAGLTPTRVRYNWADVPSGNLVDISGQPVGPFEMVVTD
jgi:sialate O-acetylesterase